MEVKTYKLVVVFAVIVLGLIAYSVLFKRNECKSRIHNDLKAINKEMKAWIWMQNYCLGTEIG